MQVIRRIALLLSLALLVGIAVGAIVRTNQAERERDLDLLAVAELAAVRADALRDHVRLATLSGADPAGIVRGLAAIEPDAVSCVVATDDVVCGGASTAIASDDLDRALARLADPGDAATIGAFDIYDGVLTVTAVRDGIAIVALAPVTGVDAQPDDAVSAWVASRTTSDAALGEFVGADGQRQISIAVDDAPGLLVAATGPAAVSLPVEEQRFYAVSTVLGLVLLALAGATVFLEQRALRERASFDALTRLPNRTEFERRASDHLGDDRERGACLLLFDLDGFKQVNDTYGHLIGDEVLRIIGGRLRTAVRDDDIVARWGGDEFVVFMPGVESEQMGMRRAEQLSEAVSGRARIDSIGTSLRLKASVGVAMTPDHGTTLDDLVESADMAMYSAKRAGEPWHLAHRPERELVSSLA